MDQMLQHENWKRSLTPELREKIADLHRLTSWTRWKIVVLLGIWAGCAVLAINVDSLWLRLPCWIVIGFVLHGLGVFMHEGAHAALFRRPWLDRSVGFLCGLPVFFPCSSYRATHLLHHQYENTPQDPDNLEANLPNPYLRWLLYYAWFIGGMPVYIVLVTLAGPFRARGWANKLAAVVEPVLIVAFHWGLFHLASRYGFMSALANGWLWALPFTVLIANIRGLAEHTQLWHSTPPDPLHSTRSLKSVGFVSFFFNNQNHHLEHHLFPGLPWNSLGKVHDLLATVYREHGASVTKGYLHWLAGAFRHGPNRTLSYEGGQAVLDPPRERPSTIGGLGSAPMG